jgi:hypothetical protein
LSELLAHAETLAERPEDFRGERGKPVEVVFPFALVPAQTSEPRAQ